MKYFVAKLISLLFKNVKVHMESNTSRIVLDMGKFKFYEYTSSPGLIYWYSEHYVIGFGPFQGLYAAMSHYDNFIKNLPVNLAPVVKPANNVEYINNVIKVDFKAKKRA